MINVYVIKGAKSTQGEDLDSRMAYTLIESRRDYSVISNGYKSYYVKTDDIKRQAFELKPISFIEDE